MVKRIILRLSNGLGNQMFMYASFFAIAKKMDRMLLIDNETAFKSKKSISRFSLSIFNFKANIAANNFKFLNLTGYIKRKFLKFFDKFKFKKNFFIEKKNKEKITFYDHSILSKKFSNNLFVEGHFESEKYFIDYKDDIIKEFQFKNIEVFNKSPFYKMITQSNSVSICLRQNRFNEGKNKNTEANLLKSQKYSNEQINYINNSIIFLKKKISNPVFFLWSNDFSNIKESLFSQKIIKVIHNTKFHEDLEKNALDLYLISMAKNHIVIPSTFNWWGAWLSSYEKKIILRPSDNYFSQFKINNNDFWPDSWLKIEK